MRHSAKETRQEKEQGVGVEQNLKKVRYAMMGG